MVTELISKYIWLIQTLSAAGDRGLSLREISDRYEERFDAALSRRTFVNYRNAVQDIFSIDILCDRATNLYSISSQSRMDGTAERLIDSFTVNMLLEQGRGRLENRISVEDIPSGYKFLTTIIGAMLENRCMAMGYCKYADTVPEQFTIHPYALKEDKRRWYLYAYCEERNALRCYALDRITGISATSGRFRLPAEFDLNALLATSFGTYIPENGEKACTIRFRARGVQAKYIEDLPIHRSQETEKKEGEWTYFSIFVNTGSRDLYFELRKYGSMIEILEPRTVIDELRRDAAEVARMYERKTAGCCSGTDRTAETAKTTENEKHII